METGENSPNLIQANNFNIAFSEQYHLSIQIGLTNCAFSILDTNDLSYQYFKSHNFTANSVKESADKLTAIIGKSEVLKATFSSLSVTYVGFPNTLVPLAVYDVENNKQILELNTEVFEKIGADDIHSQEAKLIYAIPESIDSIIETFFPTAICNAQETILIEQYGQLQNFETQAYINIKSAKVLITIFKGKKLIFNNSFEFFTKEDLLYYTLFSFEQLKLSAETIPVVLYGDISKEDENFKLMYDYIRNISFGVRSNGFSFPDEFNDLAEHKYFGLFSQVLCA
jgi:hypothetical protein